MLLSSCLSWRLCCQDHRLALRCRGIIWERCCSMLLLARTASYAWFIHSALLHLGRHPTRVLVFRQETSPPWSGQAFWYAQDIQTKMKPRYVFPTCGSSEKETSKLQLDTPNWRTATCSGELFVWLSERQNSPSKHLGHASHAPHFPSLSRNGSESQVRSNTLASHVLGKTTRLEFAWRRRYRTSRKQSPYSIAPDPLGSDRKIWMWLVCFKNSR